MPLKKVLVSFCNIIRRPESVVSPNCLAEVDLSTGEVATVPLPWARLGVIHGATGLARRDDRIFVVLQQRPSILMELDLGLNYVTHQVLEGMEGIHAILATPDEICLAVTGSDRVMSLSRNGKTRVLWKNGSSMEDTIHLNSLALIDDRLAVAAMGLREADLWKTALHGYAFFVDNGERLFSEIVHPHSLSNYFGRALVLESAMMNVRTQSESVRVPSGFLRGVAFDESLMVVGSSKGRLSSVSTGVLIGKPKGPGESLGDCLLNLLHISDGRVGGAQLTGQISLNRYADEIFDLIPLP